MATLVSFQEDILQYKKINDHIIEEISIDKKLDLSNELIKQFDQLKKMGASLTKKVRLAADKVQFATLEEVKETRQISELLSIVSIMARFIIHAVKRDEVLSISLRKNISSYSKTIDYLDEAIEDINTEIELLNDTDFQNLLKKIGSNTPSD